ncbi:hypothetical protein F5144DRAFT_605644 [Chaetomium tenue]|uniref:Uncharacterized protein n=1 Tax=Chaetomium tenue TaxID=1854479 RepID=A0ACB7NYF1_9PEZI|nr:hypothetical protein F5144DRAFT_605644 [Chaetomium globosum]
MGRPAGVVGRTQLKQDDLVRIQTLSRDARMGPSEIRRVTGYSIHQIKYALKKKTPTIGKRSGRPRKSGDAGGARAKVDGAAVAAVAAVEGVEGVDGGSEVSDGGVEPEGSGGVEVDGDAGEMGVGLQVAAGGEFVGQAGPELSVNQLMPEYQEPQQQQPQQQQEQQPPAEQGGPEQHPAEMTHELGKDQ